MNREAMKNFSLIIVLMFAFPLLSPGQELPPKCEELTASQWDEAMIQSDSTCILPLGILEKHGPHAPEVLYGILEFSGSDAFRLDVEPGQPGSEARPEDFTGQTITYTRVRPVQHIVFVWLKEPGDVETRRQLIETSKSFKKIPGVTGVSTGTPLQSDRPVVDDSFDVAVIITFESREALQNYQTHPNHTKAVEEELSPVTDRMVIYDFEVR